MIKRLKIGENKFTLVFRHKWDNKDEYKILSEFNDYRIGLWFKINKIVGKKEFNTPDEWSNNLVNNYMLGLDLIICKMWVTFCRGGVTLKI